MKFISYHYRKCLEGPNKGKPGVCPTGKPKAGKKSPAKQAVPKTNKPEKIRKKPAAIRGKMVSAIRRGKGREARILLTNGKPAPEHIKPSMVPPDWSNVKITLDPNAELLVTAKDSKGRSKSVYADTFHTRNAALKFARVREGLMMRKEMYAENQSNRKDPAKAEEADCVWLMMEQATRPGSDEDTGADEKAYGATTLLGEHVHEHEGVIWLDFIGKEGVRHVHKIKNPELGKMLMERRTRNGYDRPLFNTNYNKVTNYSKTLDGGKFTPKDFRTIKGTGLAIKLISKMDTPKNEKEYKAQIKKVAEQVSSVLGNRPQQALESYIDPTVFSPWRQANG